jgi:tRNA threonylcarbamoyladenosine biosynthesis protein TsaB
MTASTIEALTVAIDTASDFAGIALFERGTMVAESTWRSRQNQSRELLPTLEWLLQRLARSKTDLGGVVVCLGPGSYAGLRVGISTAKALAYGFDIPLAGVPRLAADAYPHAIAAPGRVVAVHAAGRAELAVAVYETVMSSMIEHEAAALAPWQEVVPRLQPTDVVCADAGTLNPEFVSALAMKDIRLVPTLPNRVAYIGELGLARLRDGDVDNADSLVPLYLRAPAIGPQPPRG